MATEIRTMMEIAAATPLRAAAASAVADLLDALKLQSAFVGEVALAAWLERPLEHGSIDVLAVLSPDRSRQVPMMASNRGFRVEKEEVEAAEELDLIPMYFGDRSGDEVRIHVLMASNALYARMMGRAVSAGLAGREIRVISAEDLALLLTVADEPRSLLTRDELILKAGAEFHRDRFDGMLVSIGLGGKTIAR